MTATLEGRAERGETQRDGAGRPLRKRVLPFIGQLLVALLLMPLVATISWLIGLWDEPTGRMLAIGWVITGAAVGIIAMAIGFFVVKRVLFVTLHVTATAFGVGCLMGITTLAGWSRIWGVLFFFLSLIGWSSWGLYRIDAFRAKATGKSGDSWGDIISLAKSKPRIAKHDEHHLVIDVELGPGETKADAEAAAKKLEGGVAAISGGTTVTAGETADKVRMSFTLSDPFAKWRSWPGLSHPGESFALPFRTAYYASGAEQWFSFAASPPSPRTKFRSDTATFIGAVGTTGSGKSGFLNNAAAEGLSRKHCILCWADGEKLFQNAGWTLDMLGMAAESRERTKRLTTALRRLCEYRVKLFGQLALDAALDPDAPMIGREWSTELAEETGEAAVLVIVDEADTLLGTSSWDWLAMRARSLGVFLLPATPRASTKEVPAAFRGSIATWKTFAIGDKMSDMFTLSSATRDAGADPTTMRGAGLHYLDMAPGVDPRMYPVRAREYMSDTRTLRIAVKQARESFTPAAFTPGAIAAMGDAYQECLPRVVMAIAAPATPDEMVSDEPADATPVEPSVTDTVPLSQIEAYLTAVASGAVEATPEEVAEARRLLEANGRPVPPAATAGSKASTKPRADYDDEDDDDEVEKEPVYATPQGTVVDDDEVAPIATSSITDPETAREIAAIDPHVPISTQSGGASIALDAETDKPRWSGEQLERELDRAIIALSQRQPNGWTPADIMAEMRCDFDGSTCSRRLTALIDGARLAPPGITVEKLKHGTYRGVPVAPSPSPRTGRN